MKTVIQQAIEKLQHLNGWYEDDGPQWISHYDVEDMLKSLISIEHKQIEDAYQAAENECEFGPTLGSAFYDASDYFTKTYTTNEQE